MLSWVLAALFVPMTILEADNLNRLQNLPVQKGQRFVVDDWNHKVTKADLGVNYFSGNSGPTESERNIITQKVLIDPSGGHLGSLAIAFDFQTKPYSSFGGWFTSLFGLTDTKVSLDGSGQEPGASTPFPGYFLDTQNIFREFSPFAARRLEALTFDIRLTANNPVALKIELKDEAGADLFTRVWIQPGGWQTVSLGLPGSFARSVKYPSDGVTRFNWRQLSLLSLIVEYVHAADNIHNPDHGEFQVDNLVLEDADGNYPDLDQTADSGTGALKPIYAGPFLDLIRATSTQYFFDWASTDARTGGLIQDRSSFPDLLSVGGAGFQLTAYVVAAERGYVARDQAAQRTLSVLKALYEAPQGESRVGTAGYKGFFYHFLGIDGRRKQNFDFTATPQVNESLNTVELSTIDTALAVAGAVTARQYFNGASTAESEIRRLADAVYARVDWPWMLNQTPGDKICQFYLGWKPIEARHCAGFQIPDAEGTGHFSGSPGAPQTLDYYTDEGLLIALLAMGSPNPAYQVDRCAWDNLIRQKKGGSFVRTWPGSLFTYQFASVWLDTQQLGLDNHPRTPLNFFDNTRGAIQATIHYAGSNPLGHTSLAQGYWGLSATEGPFDDYFAEAAPDAALSNPTVPIETVPQVLEGEGGIGGALRSRSAASRGQTSLVPTNGLLSWPLAALGAETVYATVTYSNDNVGSSETVTLRRDGTPVGNFLAEDTGDHGLGWNQFACSPRLGPLNLGVGDHMIELEVTGGDGWGIEIDKVDLISLGAARPLEMGTITPYSVASSLLHAPQAALTGLWGIAREDLDADGRPELLHPRFGFVDAFNLDIADAVIPGYTDCSAANRASCAGPWANFQGFAIDHGPMLAIIDNYLSGGFLQHLFMSYTSIDSALKQLFPQYDGFVLLSVNKTGTGQGTVTSTPAGINCGADCSEAYATHTAVTLTATPASGSTFTGWSGACTGTGACTVTLSEAKAVTAGFTTIPPPSGSGLAGINAAGQIWYTTNLSTWANIPGVLAHLVVGDFNGDGQPDLAGLNAAGQIWYTTNRSAWTNIPGALSQLVAGDFDGDGRLDDLAGLNSAGQVWFTTNLSTWTKVPGVLSQLVAGDFDGNGRMNDLAGLNSAGQIWFTTNRSTWVPVPGSLNRLVAGRLDNDTLDDLAGLNATGQIWYTTNRSTWQNVPGQLEKLIVFR